MVTVGSLFSRGECNNDGGFDLADAIFLLNFLFVAPPATLACADACDANDDESLNIADPIAMLNALFPAGPPPGLPAPYEECGPDPSGVTLGCAGRVESCP